MTGLAEIVSLGGIAVDVQTRAEPVHGGTALGTDFLIAGGGKAANVALAAHRLGAPARLVGHVGDDALAVVALRALRAAAVDLRAVHPVPRCATGATVIMVHADGTRTRVAALNANDVWTPAEGRAAADAVAAAGGGSVLVADLEVPAVVVASAVAAARDRGLAVVLDPSPAERLPADLWPACTVLTLDAAAAGRLAGLPVASPEQVLHAARDLRARGPGAVLVSLDGGGAMLVGDGVEAHLPAPRLRVVDESGADDAFAAALATGLLETRPLLEAARLAVAAAGLARTRYGAQASLPGRGEVVRLAAAS